MSEKQDNAPVLDIKNLTVDIKTASGPVNVISGLDFGIQSGMVFGLAGESGCGKSLTALSIMGLLPQNFHARGAIHFKGRDLLSLKPAALRALRGKEVAMIFQEPMTSLNPVLRVGDQIAEVMTTHMGASRREAQAMAVELLRAVKMPAPETRIREYPHQMSGGMRQRIMIAMAIACGPSLLIADEPTTALDVTIEAQILELLGSLREERRMALLLITHDLAVIAENAETVAIMYAGRLVEVADVRELFEEPRHPYTVGLLRSLPGKKGASLRPIPGYVPKPGHLPNGCKFSDRCSYVMPECRTEEPILRDINKGLREPHLARCIRAEEVKL